MHHINFNKFINYIKFLLNPPSLHNSKYIEKLDLDSRCSFLQDFPTYRNIQSRLYNKKYEFVPRDPVDMKDFDPDLPWCSLQTDLRGEYQQGRYFVGEREENLSVLHK